MTDPYNKPGSRPPEPGIYETTSEDDETPTYQHWDGRTWGYCSKTPEAARVVGHGASYFQDPRWREVES